MEMLTDDSIAPVGFSAPEPEPTLLSYDEMIPYEEQIQPQSDPSSLANRIGRGKIYLLADTAPSSSKRKALDEPAEDEAMMDEDGLDEDPEIRSNALFFTGPPIAHLPTTRIFAYATHFEAHPLGLEWVSDTTCVLVFSSKSDARKAYAALQKTPGEEPSIDDGSITAKSIPLPLWPAEERITRTLGLALGKSTEDQDREREKRKEGLSAPLRMRWARKTDVKKRGARKESEFYKKHGKLAGKELVNGRDIPSVPSGGKRRRDDEEDEELTRARLDQELDAFLAEEASDDGEDAPKANGRSLADRFGEDGIAEDEPSAPVSPPSKMRSDYIANDGRTMLTKGEPWPHNGSSTRRSRRGEGRRRRNGDEMDLYNGGRLSLSERISQEPRRSRSTLEWGPERKRRRGDGSGGGRERRSRSPGRGDGERRRGRNERPRKTQQELDDELDAFLNQGS